MGSYVATSGGFGVVTRVHHLRQQCFFNPLPFMDKGLGNCTQQMRLHGARIAESKNILSFIKKESFLKMIDLMPDRLLVGMSTEN